MDLAWTDAEMYLYKEVAEEGNGGKEGW